MGRRLFAVLTVCGVCASADAASRLIWQVSTDGGTTWQSGNDIPVYSNTTFKVRCIVDWTGTTAYGFAGLTQTIFIDNYEPSEPGAKISASGVGNRLVPFHFGAATLAVRANGTTQRVVALGIGGVEGNIASGQQAYNNHVVYSTANPAPIFMFDYVAGDIADRTLVFRSQVATSSGVPQSFSYHASQTSTSTSFRETGTIHPASVMLVFDPACRITAEPNNAVLVPGSTASFTFGFSDPTASYQWRKAGSPISDDARITGTKTATLTIRDVVSSDENLYDCVVSGACMTTTSRAAALACKATLVEQPQGGTFPAGSVVVLNSQASQTQGVTYQWSKTSPVFATLSDSAIYSGTKSPTLTIASTDPTQTGQYRVSVTNGCGTISSDVAVVTIVCVADFDGDRTITFNDFATFVGEFEVGLPRSDINADGFLDFEDFDAFVRAYERGC